MARPYQKLRIYGLERGFDGAKGVLRALAGELGRRHCYEALQVARRFEVDAETLRRLLGRRANEPWRQQLATFDGAPPYLRSFAMPEAVPLPGGDISDALADRLRKALLNEGQVLVTALMKAVTQRVRAMATYLAERTDGER